MKSACTLFLAVLLLLLPTAAMAAPGEALLTSELIQDGSLTTGSLLAGNPVENTAAPAAGRRQVTLQSAENTAADSGYDHNHDQDILAALQSRTTELSVTGWGLNRDNIKSIVNAVVNANPTVYYYNGFSFSYYPSSGEAVTITFSYLSVRAEEDEAFQTALARAKAELDAQITPNLSAAEKALVVHDYLCATIAYDEADRRAGSLSPLSFTMYGALVNHRAVCQGYSLSFLYFMQEYGIPCSLATSDTANHAWNVIQGETGCWYHVDATWDDPVWDIYGRSHHSWFLLSSATLLANSASRGLSRADYEVSRSDAYAGATDASYESGRFWTDVTARAYYSQESGLWYFLKNGQLCSCNYASGAVTPLTDLDNRWPVAGNANSYYLNFNQLYGDGRLLYISTAEAIVVYNLASGSSHEYFRPDTASGYLYGFGCSSGSLSYTLEASPSISGPEELLVITGDVNRDSYRNLADVSLLYRCCLGTYTPASADAADVNRDGSLSLADVAELFRLLYTQ